MCIYIYIYTKYVCIYIYTYIYVYINTYKIIQKCYNMLYNAMTCWNFLLKHCRCFEAVCLGIACGNLVDALLSDCQDPG